MKKRQKRHKRRLFFIMSFLLSLICCLPFALAQEVTTNNAEPEVKREQEIIQEVEAGKQAQLKGYFREYYYKQGMDYFKKGLYPEAAAKFKRALHWDPEYEPAMKYIKLIDEKIVRSEKTPVSKEIPPEAGREENKINKIEEGKKALSLELKKEEMASTEITEYRIATSDVLSISVWKVPDLSQPEVIVRPDGKISLPLIGDIGAVGLTLTQLNDEITKRYTLYVRDPQVSVMIKNFGGKRVIVLGEVTKPGVYTFTGDIRLIEALALAGDCTKYAKKKNILLIRGDIHNNPQVIISNMIAILNNARLSENVLLQPQDIIYVPRSFIGNINTFLETIAPIIDTVYKGATTEAIAHPNR